MRDEVNAIIADDARYYGEPQREPLSMHTQTAMSNLMGEIHAFRQAQGEDVARLARKVEVGLFTMARIARLEAVREMALANREGGR